MPVYQFTLNGETVSVEAPGDMPLLWVLRDLLGVTGPKYGCGVGVCGACTSHLDGAAFRPCSQALSGVTGRQVTTIEGLGGAGLHPVQQAWIDEDVAQCGFCQPGQIMAAVALLRQNPEPSDADIGAAMSENVCRCGTYVRIRSAIKRAAQALRSAGGGDDTAGTTSERAANERTARQESEEEGAAPPPAAAPDVRLPGSIRFLP